MPEGLRLAVRHTTRYAFAQPARHGLYQVRLRPSSNAAQRVAEWTLSIEGGAIEASFSDHHGNLIDLVSVAVGAEAIVLEAAGFVETMDLAGVTPLPQSASPPSWLYRRQTPATTPGPQMAALVAEHAGLRRGDVSALHALATAIRARCAYSLGATDAATTAEEALAAGQGVCQDHAHIFIGAARALGVPARYVSGYLLLEGQERQTAGHAWAEALVADLGWVGFDISNGISPDARYVRAAMGLDYSDAAPITGVVAGAAASDLDVTVQVQQQ